MEQGIIWVDQGTAYGPSQLQIGSLQPPLFSDFHSRTGEDPMTGVDASKAWEDGGEQQREDRTHPLTLSENTPNR